MPQCPTKISIIVWSAWASLSVAVMNPLNFVSCRSSGILLPLNPVKRFINTAGQVHRPTTKTATWSKYALIRHQFHQHATRAQSRQLSTSEIKTLLPPEQQFYTEEEVIKKSRFIGIATPCSSWEEAQSHLEHVRKDHPKSRHVCFGFVSGMQGVGTERCSDDGEPTGTAVILLFAISFGFY